jgi:hypothetical protein
MPAEFRKMGIAFQYPENWSLDEEDAMAGRRSVTIYSPGGAFWTISILPHSADPQEMAQTAVNAMEEEYKEVEVAEAREMLAGHELVGFDLNFFFLDLTNTALVRSLRNELGTFVVFYQAEDREYEQLQNVFRAITVSFLKNLKLPSSEGPGS